MATKSNKIRNSALFSRSIKVSKQKDWKCRLKEQQIYNSNYPFDVLLLVESSYTLCSARNKIEELGEESTAVKFLSPNNLIKFLTNTCTSRPEYSYYNSFDDAFLELEDEYTDNNKLSPESWVYLIKLRILAYNEVIAHDRELVKLLKFSLEEEMKNILNEQQPKPAKEKVPKKGELKPKVAPLGQNSLDYKYMQAKSGKLPNFVEVRKVPTIYNTDYDEPDPENIYYILSGIYDASIIPSLQKCNIEVLALVELGMEGVNFNIEEMIDINSADSEYDCMLSMQHFWQSLADENTHIPRISKNSCYIKYSIPDPASKTPSFDDFLIILKNVSDFKRLYYHYFSNVRYLDVTENSKPVSLNSMNSYNGLLNEVPNECISISLMLYALLDEVCVRVDNWTNDKLENLTKSKKVKARCHGGPVVQIKSLLRQYDCPHKKAPQIIKMPKAVKISYGNTLEYVNAHVPINNFIDTVEISLNQLKRTLPLKLFQKIDTRNTFDVLFYNYVFSKWSEQLVNVSTEELTHCVYAYLFTRGNFRKYEIPIVTSERTQVNQMQECMYGVMKLYNELQKILNVKLNTLIFKPKVSVQSNPVGNKSINRPHVFENESANSCDNLSQQYKTLAQDLDSATFIQMINVAFSNYNHFDYKYFAPTDVILIRFHYMNDNCGSIKKKQKYFLRTTLCFRDFCYKLLLLDSEWFLNEERKYWNKVYVNREKEKEYLLQHPKVDDYFDPNDFIIPGSIKHELNKTKPNTNRKSTSKNGRGEKSLPNNYDASGRKRSERKSKLTSFEFKKPEDTKVKCRVSVPLCEPYNSEKEYAFEIYNLGQNFYNLEFEEILYQSFLSVKYTKQQLPKQPLSCTFLVSSQNSNLVLHCEQNVLLKQVKQFHFNVNMTNGVIMVFSKPNPPVLNTEKYHVVMNKISNDDLNKTNEFQRSFTKRNSKLSETILDPKANELKNEVLQYLSIAMKEHLPVFKIISSRLHKYQYVKRIKSKIVLPIGNIYRRVCCKPVLYKRLSKNENVYEGKCVPYSNLVNKEKTPIHWKWNCSIPTGLSIETVQASVPHDFYIRQRYIIERTDLPGIQDEAYRCYLRCGIIMKFLKDGSIKTFSPDKSLSHYKYGYFSSNKHRVSKTNTMKDIRMKRQTNIIPLHAYKKNVSDFEKKIRKISKKYKRHLIDISDNYRFESSREEYRKMHKIYKLSKRIYSKDSHVIPLINQSVITSEGRFIDVKNNIVHDTYKKYEESRSRDYLLNETVTRREDGTAWMIDKNGNSITQFPDGSRIKTWYTILDENLILGEDLEKRVKNPAEEIESLTKFCQTNEEFEINDDDDVEVLFNKEPIKEQTSDSGFVLVGINYSFEHPNFATVSYYCWKDSSADILMADNIQVTAFAEGTYKLKLINDDIINVNTEDLQFVVHTAHTMQQESCFINLAVFSMDKVKPERVFLSVKENDDTVFAITCDGRTTNNKKYTPNTSSVDTINNVCSDRMFVMKRDLSGIEMIKEPIPYHFVHTLIDLKHVMSKKHQENVVMGPTKMKIFQPLKKTYSEHLMMMYDVPILATTKERQCMDKLWKLHDLDINTIVEKRSPLVIFERYISFLPTEIIVEQIAQAVLKCIIEGNENLPNINLIQDLVKAEEIDMKSTVVEKQISGKKFIPKHLTYKKNIAKYKSQIKNTKIPRYFETVRGLMFLAVEECSEGAMEESNTKSRSTYKKFEEKKLQARSTKITSQEKLDKQGKPKINNQLEGSFVPESVSIHKLDRQETSILSNTYPAKLNIPDRLSIHLKPNAPVHEIILTANGLQIITDKNVDNYYYKTQGNTNSQVSAPNVAFPREDSGKRIILEKASESGRSNSEINQKCISSFFGEDIGGYFDSTVKIPSWDDSLCQKACINSNSTTNTNTLVTIPEIKPSDLATCNPTTCACSVESIQRLATCCKCNKYYCNCKNTYSTFATCAVQNELKISEAICVLAIKIIQTIEKDAAKFSLLHSKLENIIRDTANAWTMSESVTNDLIKTLKWIIENKIKTQNTIPEEHAINIVKQIEATVSKIKISKCTMTLSIGNLQKMADLVLKLVCNSKNNSNIVKEIRKLLGDAQISRLDIIDTLKLAKEKIHLYYEYGLYPDLPLPEIPAESKCCKIAQYVYYKLDNMLEDTCEKCNSRSIVNMSSVHNTSPVYQRSKQSFEKSETRRSLTKKLSDLLMKNTSNDINSFTYKDEENKEGYYTHLDPCKKTKPNIIIEPLNYSSEAQENKYTDDDFDVSSAGGYSLVKSCDEILDVSIPFINTTGANMNINNRSAVHETVIEESPAHDRDTHNDYILSKIILSEVPMSKEIDLITILAPEQQQDSGVTYENNSTTLFSPILLRSTQESPKNINTKPIVYDGNIFSK